MFCSSSNRLAKQAEDYFKKAQALVLFPGQPNLTPTWAKILDALGLSYTVLCKLYTETPGKGFLLLRRKRNGVSIIQDSIQDRRHKSRLVHVIVL